MCGRYELKTSGEVFWKHFRLEGAPWLSELEDINHTPGKPALIVVREGDHNTVMESDWKRIFEKGAKRPLWTINARSERVFQSRAFSSSAKKRRCLVPATAFYEFSDRGPMRFSVQGDNLFGMAGIWRTFGSVPVCSILTTSPNKVVSPYHDRMPVILKPEVYEHWLDPSAADEGALREFFRPVDHEWLTVQPVRELAREKQEYGVLLPRQQDLGL